MQTNHHITIAHHLPGRLRVTIPVLAKWRELARAIKLDLAGASGVTRVSANAYCGSLTITYDSNVVDHNDLLKTIGTLLRETSLALNDRDADQRDRPAARHRQAPAIDNAAAARDVEPAAASGHWNPWNLAGTAMVGLGVAGAVLPLIPTVPPLLLAAYCYSRGSQRFYERLISHRYFGKLIRDHQDGNGMSARAKKVTIAILWVSMGMSMLFFVSDAALRIVMLLIGTAVTVHILRMKTAR